MIRAGYLTNLRKFPVIDIRIAMTVFLGISLSNLAVTSARWHHYMINNIQLKLQNRDHCTIKPVRDGIFNPRYNRHHTLEREG